MADPKLTKTQVVIKYWADDGYSLKKDFRGGKGQFQGDPDMVVPPESALLDGLAELQRLCNLFGFGQAADAQIAAVNGRMGKWREPKENEHG